MDKNINTIGLIVKNHEQPVVETLQAVVEHLIGRGHQILLDHSADTLIAERKLDVVDRDTLGQQCQLVIIIGGDGTFLSASRSLANYGVPILGINLGRLGFLVDISPNQMAGVLDQVLQGEYIDEKRFMLTAKVVRGSETVMESDAFNDIVVHIRDMPRMIDFVVYIDGDFVNNQRADGMVVSTPTGSTAYALSGGGPLLHPSLEAIVLVPICPHTLSNRPIVINSSSKVEIVISESNLSTTPQIAWDGQSCLDLQAGDRIEIQRKETDIHLIHPKFYDYFEILRAKLRWSEIL